MAAPERPIEFEVGGDVYSVAFTTNAICSLEDDFGGASIVVVGDMISKGTAGVRGARALFRAALVEDRPEISPVEAGRLMEELGSDRTAELVQEAFERLKAGLERSIKLPAPDARGRIGFEAGGMRLVLSFHMNAQAEMEAYFGGLKPEAIMRKLNSGGAGINDMRALFRAALVDHKEVTLQEAGRIMDRIGLRVAGEAVKAAYAAAFPEAEPEDDPPEANRRERRAAAAKRSPTRRPAKGGTGKRS